jgi:hypothetical protein
VRKERGLSLYLEDMMMMLILDTRCEYTATSEISSDRIQAHSLAQVAEISKAQRTNRKTWVSGLFWAMLTPVQLRTAPQSSDQSFDNPFNKSLQVSAKTKKPVRVIRGYKLKSRFAPLEG